MDKLAIAALERERVRDPHVHLQQREQGRIDGFFPDLLVKVLKRTLAVLPVIRGVRTGGAGNEPSPRNLY
ncbi:MAG: hypothetical protein GX651_07415 [Methanomicrobiales archaeon]|nr:hypothetical protein [Methanomicrobiales archaeon]